MIVCIDTNSLVQLFGKRSPYRAIVVAAMSGRIELAVSSAILLEYEEVAAAMYGPVFAKEVMGFLALATPQAQCVWWIRASIFASSPQTQTTTFLRIALSPPRLLISLRKIVILRRCAARAIRCSRSRLSNLSVKSGGSPLRLLAARRDATEGLSWAGARNAFRQDPAAV